MIKNSLKELLVSNEYDIEEIEELFENLKLNQMEILNKLKSND
jgi:hypothetical protein